MEFRPTITCDGDFDLLSQFKEDIERRLSSTTVEWKRSHGRPSKLVVVKGQIKRLTKEHLKYTIETTPSLKNLPFFHMLWTDCQDFDDYRNDVKERINKWLKSIKASANSDWLIVQVITQGSLKGNKPKLQLPRSSVFDKIRSDFGGGKANERCIQLWEPSKHEGQNPKSVESWQTFMNKLRQSVLLAVDRNLRKFEDKVRKIRDKRTENNWNFTNYFLCHEEVAMVYEMMGLIEEALIHYDEIDALVSQLVNQVKTSDHCGPLALFTKECWCWDGASISVNAEKKLRERIRTKEATLLDMRNYLFIRQCALLFHLDRVEEVLQRMLKFMHNVVHELSILKVPMPDGAASCWVSLSSLQLIRSTIQKNPVVVTYSLHSAQIYQYARLKLFDLGRLCGLMPDVEPTGEQLNLACGLSGGIGKNDEVKFSEGNPSNKLKSALSSQDGFKALYLELLQMAIKTYENIKRTRSAKILGIDLGKFYMSGGSYGDAEDLLTEGYKMFAEEGWNLLAANTLRSLAQCQFQLRNWEKYARSCAVLACQAHFKKEEIDFFTEELFRLKDDPEHADKPLIVRADPLLKPEMIKIYLNKKIATVGETVCVEIELNSGLERIVEGCTLSISMRMSVAPQDSEPIRLTTSGETADPATMTDTGAVTSSNDSPAQTAGDEKVKEKFVLQSEKVDIVCGRQICNLSGTVKKSGMYLLQQLLIKMGNLHFLASLQRLPKDTRKFTAVSESPKISWAPRNIEIPLVAGLTQTISLSISTGPAAILDKSILKVTSESGLLFEALKDGQAFITSEADEKFMQTKYSIQLSQEVEGQDSLMSSSCAVTLPWIPPYHVLKVDMLLFSKFEMEDGPFTVDHDVLSCASWVPSNPKTTLFLKFYKPFLLEHIPCRTKYGDFIQVILTGTTYTGLLVSDVAMKSNSESDCVKLLPLHTVSSQAVFYQSEISFLWRIEKKVWKNLNFSLRLAYCCRDEDQAGRKHVFAHDIEVDFGSDCH